MINHYIAIVSSFPKLEVGLRVEEIKTEAYKSEKIYLGISFADIKTSLMLSLYFDLCSGKWLLFLTDTHINMKPSRASSIYVKAVVHNVQWNVLNASVALTFTLCKNMTSYYIPHSPSLLCL